MAKQRDRKDLMHIIERINRFGELSLELHCSGKDPVTRKHKVYVKTYKVPTDITAKKKLEEFRLRVQLEFRDEVAKRSSGTLIGITKNVRFADFAKEWVEDILNLHKQSHNYYRASCQRLKVLNQQLGHFYLAEISPAIVKNFCKWLATRSYEKSTATVKESLRPLIKASEMSLVSVQTACNISHATLHEALFVGRHIAKDTAKAICKYLNVPLHKYFTIETIQVPYSSGTTNSLKTMLHSILQEAVRQELIPRNVAKEFTSTSRGARKERKIFTDEEIKQFLRCLENEPDIRKRVAFSIYINLGLRNCEVAGLEWKDFNFDTSEVRIQRNCLYVGKEFGMVTKETKTRNSNRVIAVPLSLLTLLKEYKGYWDKQKQLHGDLWEHTDRLFCQDNGKDMAGSTIAGWLAYFEKTNGLKHVTPHGLRHTHITTLIKNGIDVKTVSGRVGHANITTTLEVYSHFTKEGDKKAANKLDELFNFG